MRKRYYIGIANTTHDAAIAIVDDLGQVLFAEGAERPYQVKRAFGCPPDNIIWAETLIEKYCIADADYLLTKSWTNKRVRRSMLIHSFAILRLATDEHIKQAFLKITGISSTTFATHIFLFKNFLATTLSAGTGIELTINKLSETGHLKTITYDHHLSHAGFACYTSPFSKAICLVADGVGERGSFSLFKYDDGKIIRLEQQKNSVSMGQYYGALTNFCGFDDIKGEEWKVMGLAAYGRHNEQLSDLFNSLYYVDNCTIKHAGSQISRFKIARKIQLLRTADSNNFSLRADIAYNGQLMYCSLMNELLTNIHKKYPADNLILTGGCALNSSHNGEILDKTPFKYLHVPSAPADDGNALGSALLAYYADHPHKESIHKNLSPYLGTEITDDQLQHFLQFSGHKKVRLLADDKYDTVAQLLADGKIIGWVQGRAEYGPRALGNRSILADPRGKDIKDIINERVKFREEFRPFAPSILHEYGHEYFEHYQESHYMERTLTFKKEAIDKVPGVVHSNNTGRLQTVKEDWNRELYHLIKAFHAVTGVPVLLNTSFNIMGKPIIHTIEDALSTFMTTGIDALVINNYLIEK